MSNISNQLNINNLLKTKWGEQFNNEQMEQIRIGAELGIDISIYAKPEYPGYLMNFIRGGILNNYSFEPYINPDFTREQVEMIQFGLIYGFDPSVYANPNLSEAEMKELMFKELERQNEEINNEK